jgi:AcrR family transcriptional regulator
MAANDSGGDRLERRIHDAALRCVARWGIAKTTLDDVAREAGCSRATIYRTFAGGKQALLDATLQRELTSFKDSLTAELDRARSLEDLLVAGLTAASRAIAEHQAFQFLLAHEPDVVLPALSFRRLDDILRLATEVGRPQLSRFLPAAEAGAAAEWIARVILSYTLTPSGTLDPRREADARRLVRTYVLPGLVTEAATSAPAPSHLQELDPWRPTSS